MTINGYFDVKRCKTCACNLTEILNAFNKKPNLRRNIISFIPFGGRYMMSSFNDKNKEGSHDSPNVI